jgi:hypothetical protein
MLRGAKKQHFSLGRAHLGRPDMIRIVTENDDFGVGSVTPSTISHLLALRFMDSWEVPYTKMLSSSHPERLD